MLVSIVGNIGNVLCFTLVGPVPFLGIHASLILMRISAGVLGFAFSAIMVSSFIRAHRATLEKGCLDNMNTYLLTTGKLKCISKLQNSCYIMFEIVSFSAKFKINF